MARAVRMLAILLLAALAAALLWRVLLHQELPAPVEVAQPEAPADAPTVETFTEGDLVLDLFNPSDTALQNQLSETALKRQVEEAIIATFILRRCGILSASEYEDSFRALQLYTHRAQPQRDAAQLEQEFQSIVESSKASYGLIYARLSCDIAQLTGVAGQLAQWRAHMLVTPAQ